MCTVLAQKSQLVGVARLLYALGTHKVADGGAVEVGVAAIAHFVGERERSVSVA